MSTKTKKTNGKKPTESALSASGVSLGPIFAGQGPFPGRGWSTFPPDYPPLQPPPCPGFWAAVKHFPLSGGIVAQLGAEPGTGQFICGHYAAYQYEFRPNVAYELVFNLTLNFGPISRRPRYGQIYTWAVLQVWGPNGFDRHLRDDLNSYAGITLSVRLQMEPRQTHYLNFGVVPVVENAGYQSYGEIIVKSASLEARYPYGVQAAETISFDVAGRKDSPLAFIDPDRKQKTRKISLKEAIELGTAEIQAK